MNRGLLLVISGPSGAGKGSVCDAYKKKHDDVWNSVSMTTRSPREGEVEGVSYFFSSIPEFKKKIENNEFLEYAEVYGNFYGTPKASPAAFHRLVVPAIRVFLAPCAPP